MTTDYTNPAKKKTTGVLRCPRCRAHVTHLEGGACVACNLRLRLRTEMTCYAVGEYDALKLELEPESEALRKELHDARFVS